MGKYTKTRKGKRGGALVGKGAYGCVYRPAVRCNGNTRARNRQITKYMARANAIKEYGKKYILQEVDPTQEFFVYPSDICRPAPNLNSTNQLELSKCKLQYPATHFLQMANGGSSLFQLQYPPAHPPSFLRSLLNLCEGIRLLHAHKIAHMDLKMHNAVVQGTRARWIDVGMLVPLDLPAFHRIPADDKRVFAENYFVWPYETRFLVQALNPVTHRQLNVFYETVVRKINFTFPVPLTMYYNGEGQRYLTPRYVNDELLPLLQRMEDQQRIEFLATKTDIYSLGMVLLKVTEATLGSKNPFRILCSQMMDIRPDRRPTAEQVCTQFEKLLGP
jgi:serine/threonine protein kinase